MHAYCGFLTGAICGAYTVVGTAVLVSGGCASLGGDTHYTLVKPYTLIRPKHVPCTSVNCSHGSSPTALG